MTDVRPFRALRYDPRRVELAKVLAPVYDVVAPEDRPLYWERDPYNALRLELTKSVEEEAATDYAEAAERLVEWRRAGVLVRDAEPALYVLRQTFTAEGGRTLARTGFLAALRLEDYAKRIVRPHERTLAGPKADRLKILRATRVNLSSSRAPARRKPRTTAASGTGSRRCATRPASPWCAPSSRRGRS